MNDLIRVLRRSVEPATRSGKSQCAYRMSRHTAKQPVEWFRCMRFEENDLLSECQQGGIRQLYKK